MATAFSTIPLPRHDSRRALNLAGFRIGNAGDGCRKRFLGVGLAAWGGDTQGWVATANGMALGLCGTAGVSMDPTAVIVDTAG